jgi:trk system potassium uptake protein TrkH
LGASETYAAIPAVGKILLAACMLLGRLEIYTILVLFSPAFWRR